MPDREKVDKGLERCMKAVSKDDCNGCPYQNDYAGFARRDCGETSCVSRLMEDARELLKERKEVELCDRCGRYRLESGRR